jgi:hypothetical protein
MPASIPSSCPAAEVPPATTPAATLVAADVTVPTMAGVERRMP